MFRLGIVLLAIAFISSCKSQQAQDGNKSEAKEFVDEDKKIRYNTTFEILPEKNFTLDSQRLNFQITSVSFPVVDQLKVSVKYGGGCKMHEFRLIYPKPAESDTIQLYLLHLTDDDHCKAFVMNDLEFDFYVPFDRGKFVVMVNKEYAGTVVKEH